MSDNKKKILHLVTRLETGGTLEFFVNFFSAIPDSLLNKYDITLLLGSRGTNKERIKSICNNKGIKINYIEELIRNINPYYDLKAFLKILEFIRKEKFDVVYAHTSKAGLLGRLACYLLRVPIVVYCPHGHVYYGYFNKFISRLIILIEKFLANITDKIIVSTELEKNDNLKLNIGTKEKFVVIPQGMDLNRFNININIESKKKEFGIIGDEKVIGVIARLVPVKGHRYFLNALPLILKKIANIKVLIIGDGILREELENRAKELGLTKKILFLGTRNDIPEIMKICDLIVLPSLNEAFGLSIMEAQICGVPVVAANVGGIPEVVKDKETGLLVPACDTKSLAEAIIYLFSDYSALKTFGDNAKIWAENRFNIKNIVNKWFEVIGERF